MVNTIVENKELKSLRQSLSESHINILLLIVFLTIIGTVSILYDKSNGQTDCYKILIYPICLIIYAYGYITFKRKNFSLITSIVFLLFYLLHTGLEIVLGYYPDNIITNITFTGTGTLNRGTILIDVIPLVYIIFRIGLSIIFIRLIAVQLEIRKCGLKRK